MNDKYLSFKVSSHLKNIIGKDLITDRYVAIYELVKNSLDAGATNVDVKIARNFIIVKDNGSGMSLSDIKNKWLFVGYSEKKEDLGVFAGSKGIGRFSSDTLGERLIMKTRKKSNLGIELEMNWMEFEKNQSSLLEQVSLAYKEIDDMDYGTELIITDLRSIWEKKHIVKLKDYLSKLKNPFEIIESISINLESDYSELSGSISNNVIETIIDRSIYLKVEISSNFIRSVLTHNGNFVCEISYENDTILDNVTFELFHLSTGAKMNFTKKMGVPFTRYGNIFIYRNGYRVIPYGNEDYDIFGLNIRKTQGVNRYLGTRDLLGYISIKDTHNNFKEVTSRDGGFVVNDAFLELQDIYMEYHRFLEDFMKITAFNKLDSYQIDKSIVRRFLRKKVIDYTLGEKQKETNIEEVMYKIDKDLILTEQDKKVLKEKDISEKFNQKLFSDIVNDNKVLLKKNQSIEKQLEIKQRLINKIEGTSLSQDILEHHLNIETNQMDRIFKNLKNDDPLIVNSESFKKFEVKFYDSILKLRSLRNLIKSVNYDTRVANTNDIIQFVSEYCEEWARQNSIVYNVYTNDISYVIKYKAILLTVVLDNILDNALSFNASNLRLYVNNEKDYISIKFQTNTGKSDNTNTDDYFSYGFTTKKRGTGNGMFFIKKIITENFYGNVDAFETIGKFIIELKLPIRVESKTLN